MVIYIVPVGTLLLQSDKHNNLLAKRYSLGVKLGSKVALKLISVTPPDDRILTLLGFVVSMSYTDTFFYRHTLSCYH